MLLRLLYLIALIGVVGGDSRTPTTTTDADDPGEARLGGEGFGNIVMLFVVLGALVLVGIIVLAMLALSGQFENELVDPAV